MAMAENPIPVELRRFIAGTIQSVEKLEILCLLVENPSKSWSPIDAFRRIQSTERSVLTGLVHFERQGLSEIDPQGEFRFSPKSPELRDLALTLVKTYRERPVAIIETIYKKPEDSLQHFADAFRLRKEK